MFGWIKRRIRRKAIRKLLTSILEKPEMGFLKGLFSSKKLGAVFAGILTVILREALGLDDATVKMIVELLMSYLIGQSAVDLALSIKGNKTE